MEKRRQDLGKKWRVWSNHVDLPSLIDSSTLFGKAKQLVISRQSSTTSPNNAPCAMTTSLAHSSWQCLAIFISAWDTKQRLMSIRMRGRPLINGFTHQSFDLDVLDRRVGFLRLRIDSSGRHYVVLEQVLMVAVNWRNQSGKTGTSGIAMGYRGWTKTTSCTVW